MIEISHTNAFQSFSYFSLLDVQYFISYQIQEEEKVKEKEDKAARSGMGKEKLILRVLGTNIILYYNFFGMIPIQYLHSMIY
jgi:hypothetical protein